MTELALHILDIARNAVQAGSSLTEISVCEDLRRDELVITIRDNGRGMTPDQLEKTSDPFFTTGNKRTGLGIPLLKQQCESAGGKFSIHSEPGKGTQMIAVFMHSHIDRQPLGDLTGTIISLIRSHPDLDWVYDHRYNDREFRFDTREIRTELEGIPLNSPEVIRFLKEMITGNTDALSET